MPTRWTEPEGEKFALGAIEEQEHWQSEYYRIVSEASEQARSAEASVRSTATGPGWVCGCPETTRSTRFEGWPGTRPTSPRTECSTAASCEASIRMPVS